jgi:hypothetical protein
LPANVGIEFAKAKKKFEEAKTDLERLIALQEMKSTAPTHKGAEKLRAEITKKIAQTKKRIEKQKEQAKKTASLPSMHVKKEGAGQVVLVGTPNSGKSYLLRVLTNAEVEVKDYEFTTTKPVQGMTDFKGAKIQLVEVPAIIEGSSEGKAQGTQVLSVIRNADALVLVVEESNALEQLRLLLKELRKAKVLVNERRPLIEVKHSSFPGISISGKNFLKVKKEQLIEFLKGLGYGNASVVLNEDTDLEKTAKALDESLAFKKALVLVNKGGAESPELKEALLNEFKESNLEKKELKEMVCWFNEEKTNELKEKIFQLLDKILVYTKKPGKEVDKSEPLVLEKGATIEDLTKKLHKDFAEKMKFARVWGSTKFPGQRVGKDFELKSGDIVEVYS